QEVFVDDNQFVQKGTPLVQLDDSMYRLAAEQKRAQVAQARLAVAQKIAAMAVAHAELEQARAQARAQVAGLHAAWALVGTVKDFVAYEMASLAWGEANIRQQQANERLAQSLYDRVKNLNPS